MRELQVGNRVTLESNRMEYASIGTKVSYATQMFDRGVITINDIREVFNQSPISDGDKRYIRKEYAEVNQLGESKEEEQPIEKLAEVEYAEIKW